MLARRWLRALLLCTAAVGVGDAAAIDKPPFSIDFANPRIQARADLAIVDSETPPPADAAWRPVQLPETWRSPERWRQGDNGWYRFILPGGVPEEAQSVYLWRFSMNAAVWFNGDWIGDVARALEITTNTAASYTKSLYRKLEVTNRAEATLEATRRGLIRP
jgi:hypothetical protein